VGARFFTQKYVNLSRKLLMWHNDVIRQFAPFLPCSHLAFYFERGRSMSLAVWLLFELAIFRDTSFAAPWLYSLVMIALGLIYFVWMLVTRPRVLKIAPQGGEPETEVS